jgi:hypothetical protein
MFVHKFSNVAFSALVMGSVALPTLAQTPSAGNATTAPATHDSGQLSIGAERSLDR